MAPLNLPLGAAAPGPVLVELVVGDEPDAWRAAGFNVDGVRVARVGQVRVRFVGAGGLRGIRSWSFRTDDAESGEHSEHGDGQPLTDEGIDTTVTSDPIGTTGAPAALTSSPDPAGAEPAHAELAHTEPARALPAHAPPAHPNHVVTVDHVVVVTSDTDRTTAAFAALGLSERRVRPFVLDGRDLVQVFYRAGEAVIEQVGPPEQETITVAEQPTTFFGIGFTVDDIDAALATVGEAASAPRPAVQPGRTIATLRHRALGISVPVVLLSPRAPRGHAGSEASPP